MTPLIVAAKYVILTNTDLMLFVLYSWMVSAQMFMIEIILRYTFSNSALRFMLKFVYYIFQMALGMMSAMESQVQEGTFYLNALFPLTQA